ncbi:MAG TPA: YafY family protein [Acidimicrobiia bacterium]|jgi:predicted DNA-binding transcriptional regulator YafY
MLRLLSLLQARPNWTGPELAGRLEVTDRTLRRDITRLRDLGYPVEAFSGPAGGYRLAAGGALPPLLLEDDEAVVVAMGLRTAAAGALPGFEDAAVAALAKIEQVLPLRLRERIGDLDSSIVSLTRAQPRASQIDADDLVALARACRLPERLRFAYIDSEGRASERHVEPFQLVHAARRWYLVAFDRDREAWRTFRVDRIDQIQPTGMRFTHRDPPDAAGLVAEGLAVSVYRWQARVLLRVKPEVARSFISPATGVIEPTRGGTLLRIGADDLDWIARMLAGYPCPFKVLDPPELRAAVADLAKELASYSS